jgi:hypothetical protein
MKCIVCSKVLGLGNGMPHCNHIMGKYLVNTWYDGEVRIYTHNDERYRDLMIVIQNPKRLNEEYIDMMLLLK